MSKAMKGKDQVLRITVDEKLDKDLFRFLASPVSPDREEFFLDSSDWGDEDHENVHAKEYENSPLTRIVSRNIKWRDLKEGQVFVTGGFLVKGSDQEPEAFVLSKGARSFIRVDSLVRRRVRALYSKLLAGREDNASY